LSKINVNKTNSIRNGMYWRTRHHSYINVIIVLEELYIRQNLRQMFLRGGVWIGRNQTWRAR